MGVLAMQTPEAQILPLAPTNPDLQALMKWAQDLTRTLQQNLSSIARKANDTSTVPMTGDLNAGGFSITNINNLGNIAGTITYKGADIDTRYVNVTGDTMTGNLFIQAASAVNSAVVVGNTLGSGSLVTGSGGNINVYFDNSHTLNFNTASKANIDNATFSGAVNLYNMNAAGVGTWTSYQIFPAATTSIPSIRLPHGVAPTSPTNGDIWTTTAALYARLNGVTYSFPTLEASNAYAGNVQSYTSATSSGPQMYLINTTADNAGPYYLWRKQRGSSAVSVNDILGNMQWQAMDSTPTVVAAAGFSAQATAVSATEVSGRILWATAQTGYATRMTLTSGLSVGSSIPTDQGNGTVNAQVGYYVNSVALPHQKEFESSQQTITAAGALTLAHGLGVKPKLYMAVIICQTAELGYSIGDEVQVNPSVHGSSTESRGLSLVPDATNINVRFGSGTVMDLINKTTGAVGGITAANWKLVVRAWA